MGAINNAFNQAAGAAAGAALAIKHAKETDFSKMTAAEHSALIANNQAVDAEAAAKDAKLDEDPTNRGWIEAVLDSWVKDEAYQKAQKRKNASTKTVTKKLKEWEAAKRAIDELDNKLYSIETMKQRAAEQRAYADKASQIASKAQQKYQSKWGNR